MPFAEMQEGQLHYALEGAADAPVLVLSNSLGTSFSMWEPQMAAFLEKFRVLRYDTRGHGQSFVTPGPYSIEQLGRDVVSLLDAVGLERVHFCGLSLGGMTGMWLGTHAPDRLNKLILSNTAAKIGTTESWNARIATVREQGMKPVAVSTMERWFTTAFRASHPESVTKIQRMLETANRDGFVASCGAVRDMDQRESISAIPCETLVVAGTHDPGTPPADGRFLCEKIRGARYVELNAAHLSNVEDHLRFNSEVLSFLAA